MLKLKKIAITGGLAAGKTSVCKIFEELGAYVVSADEIVHQLLSPQTTIGQQVEQLLGSSIINKDGFDRKKIADIVFSQPNLLAALEGIMHPAIFDEIEKRYHMASEQEKYTMFVAEIPLLFETQVDKNKANERFDSIISVSANRDLCRDRFRKQTHYSAQEFDNRMNRQLTPESKADKAHYVLENNGTFEQLKNKAKTLYFQIKESDFP